MDNSASCSMLIIFSCFSFSFSFLNNEFDTIKNLFSGIIQLFLLINIFYKNIYAYFIKVKNFKIEAENKLIKSCITQFFKNYEYFRGSSIPFQTILDSNLFNSKRIFGKNYFQSSYNGIKFMCQRTLILGLKEYFKGIWIAIETKFRLDGTLHIVEKGILDRYIKRHKDLTQIETESIDFNAGVNIFTNNESLAFYVLTPQIIEIFTRVKNMDGQMLISFSEGHLHIALKKNKRFFNVIFNQNVNDQYRRILSECKLIRDVMNELTSINNKIIN